MRHTYEQTIVRRGDKFAGIALGFDFCAEHEVGVGPLREKFGQGSLNYKDRSTWGADRYTATRVPDVEVRVVDSTYKSLSTSPGSPERFFRTLGCGACWDKWDFAYLGVAEDVDALHQAILDKDLCVGIPLSIGKGGLILFRKSLLLPEEKEALLKLDENYAAARHFEDESGLLERVPRDKYFHLSAKRNADGAFRWWLNPVDQRNNNAGWYTTEELDQWLLGEGPVCKRRE